MENIQLKPCPFCGAKAKVIWLLGRRCIACTGCLAAMIPNYKIEEEQLLRLWNNRDSAELMRHYRQGLADARAMADGELMQAFNPD